MEKESITFPHLQYSTGSDDAKYLCGLSTILVATIQEVKDRVSQIEFIFCSQLFPNIQERSKILQKRLDDANRAAEDKWKEKETSLKFQIQDLQMGKKWAEKQVEQLSSTLEQNKSDLFKAELLLKQREVEKQQLLDKLDRLIKNEDMISNLTYQVERKSRELEEGKQLQQNLLQQSEMKEKILLVEQKKRIELTEEFNKLKDSYKQLKSQYLFAIEKINKNSVIEQHLDKVELVNDSSKNHSKKRNIQDSEKTDGENLKFPSKQHDLNIAMVSNVNLEVGPSFVSLRSLNADSHVTVAARSTSISRNNVNASTKCASSTSPNIRESSWRETRAHQGPQDRDPDNDFLDTPMEILRNSNKGQREEAQDMPCPPEDIFNNSDDETQDINTQTITKPQGISSDEKKQDINARTTPKPKQMPILGSANKGFKYIEPVRKKSERENLKGVQCQQCKKFYDAVLPDGADKSNNSTDMFCEHHDGVSRHRYRYVPPMTPEGFWNIGFDSEL